MDRSSKVGSQASEYIHSLRIELIPPFYFRQEDMAPSRQRLSLRENPSSERKTW